MLSIPSSRRLVILFACLTTITLMYRLSNGIWSGNNLHFEATLMSQFQYGTSFRFPLSHSSDKFDLSEIYEAGGRLLSNPHIARFASCTLEPNNRTNAVRLPHRILNISFTPPNVEAESKDQYFNPTFIPLPPYSPYPYLLVSRLVTSGLHQESHICLAILCITQNQNDTQRHSLTPDAHVCDPSGTNHLGPYGGLRCATPPEKLNIPPTPAYRCENAWAAFPDIPGFHDPRVFWSGKGEPLIIVNSASQYSCVGLWVVDLRAVYPQLADLLGKKEKYAIAKRAGDVDEGGRKWRNEISTRISYPHLTELTRNPRQSRSAVEKNWVMFFPRKDEAWVQYDLVAHGHGRRKEKTHQHAHAHHVDLSLLAAMGERVAAAGNGSTSTVVLSNDSVATVGMANRAPNVVRQIAYEGSITIQNLNDSTTNHEPSNMLEHTDHSSASLKYKRRKLQPSRTLAKLIGSGYTTTNLTSSNEAPCLTAANVLDALNNSGHWHQGTNSLRLILCHRHDTSCLGSHAQDSDDERLIATGQIVHFAFLHRKFSNELDLPMRYERYVMVWEARYPFRMLGISRFPILFEGEKMRPWTNKENGLDANRSKEVERWEGVYFTYTPSIAWAWRRDIGIGGGDEMSLGTGYLGDDVLVGIGMDDVAQGFVRVKADELLTCLRLCPDFDSER